MHPTTRSTPNLSQLPSTWLAEKILPNHILNLYHPTNLILRIDDPQNRASHQKRLAPPLGPHLQDPLPRIPHGTISKHADPIRPLNHEAVGLPTIERSVQVAERCDAPWRDDVDG